MPFNALNMGVGRALLEIASYFSTAYSRIYLWVKGVKGGSGIRCYGTPLIRRHVGSEIRIGRNASLRNWFSSNEMGVTHKSFISTRYPESAIKIGDSFKASGVTICAEKEIAIGDNVTVGANTTIIDSDFHPLSADERRTSPKDGHRVAVRIGDNVFIGMQCIILKGTNIGAGCIVGAGSVVAGNFSENCVIGGNPAAVIKTNLTEK